MNALAAVVLAFVVSCILLVSPLQALDCFTDLDCSTGNRCVKEANEDKGTCLEGTKPRSPLSLGAEKEKPKPLRHTAGKMCWGSKDCDPGQECMMKEGQMYGTCR